MLEPRRLLTFREVARQRSFSRAAEVLALTQPAVSQQIRALETQLGERLIERGRGGFALTPPGELLLTHADALFERLQRAESELAEEVAAERRRLRVGAFPSALATIVPAAIAELRASVEGLEVTVTQGDAEELVAAVRAGDLHIALCFQDAADAPLEHEDTHRHDLLEEPMLAAVGPRHRLASRSRLRLSQLRDDTWIAASPDGLIRRACVAVGFEPRLAYLTSDPLAIRALVAAGLAVTLTPRLLAAQLHGISTPAVSAGPRRTIYAVVPQTTRHPLVPTLLEGLRGSVR